MTRANIEDLAYQETEWLTSSEENQYYKGFKRLSSLITEHLNSLPLDQMTGKEVEESLWNEFLHIQ